VTILDEQFAELQRQGARHGDYSAASLTPQPNGTSVVELRNFLLPPGWNKQRVTVYFIVPVGYPVARPDTFWTDPDLRLANGGPAVNTGNNQQPGVPGNLLWFSWHPSTWNPNRDNLVSYVAMITRRFEQVR